MLTVPSSILSGLWPPFAEAVRYLQLYVDYFRLDARVTSGHRSMEEQARLYAKGRTPQEIKSQVAKRGTGGAVTDAPPGASAHNWGLAIDVEGRDQAKVIQLGRALGFGTVSWDPAHLEWPGWQQLLR